MSWIGNLFKSKAEKQYEEERRNLRVHLHKQVEALKNTVDSDHGNTYQAVMLFFDDPDATKALNLNFDEDEAAKAQPDYKYNPSADTFFEILRDNAKHIPADDCLDFSKRLLPKISDATLWMNKLKSSSLLTCFDALAHNTPAEQKLDLYDSFHSGGILKSVVQRNDAIDVARFYFNVFDGVPAMDVHENLRKVNYFHYVHQPDDLRHWFRDSAMAKGNPDLSRVLTNHLDNAIQKKQEQDLSI